MPKPDAPLLAPLVGPLVVLGLAASATVAFQGDDSALTPAPSMAALALGASALRTRSARLTWFVPLCVAAFVIASRWDLLAEERERAYRAMLLVQLVRGVAFAALLLPLVLVSVRGRVVAAPAVLRSQRRSTWVVAAGTAGPLSALARVLYGAWPLVADIEEPRVHPRWQGGFQLLMFVAVATIVAFSTADALALSAEAARAHRSASAPGSRKALVTSIAIDFVALLVAMVFLLEPWRSRHARG
jgi:hypothetical protein